MCDECGKGNRKENKNKELIRTSYQISSSEITKQTMLKCCVGTLGKSQLKYHIIACRLSTDKRLL